MDRGNGGWRDANAVVGVLATAAKAVAALGVA